MEKQETTKKVDELDRLLADVVLDYAPEFRVGERAFRIHPVTLAKTLRLKPHIKALELDASVLRTSPYMEALRVAAEHREECCHILAVRTMRNTRAAFHNLMETDLRRELFCEVIDTTDLAFLMLHVLSGDRTEVLMRHLGLDRERERLSQVMAVKRKGGRNNLGFGGVSFLGAFIGQLQEMGYTDEEIIYERNYSYLLLRLADKVTSIYVTDEELAELPTEAGGTLLRGDDPDAADGLLAVLAERGVTSARESAPHTNCNRKEI